MISRAICSARAGSVPRAHPGDLRQCPGPAELVGDGAGDLLGAGGVGARAHPGDLRQHPGPELPVGDGAGDLLGIVDQPPGAGGVGARARPGDVRQHPGPEVPGPEVLVGDLAGELLGIVDQPPGAGGVGTRARPGDGRQRLGPAELVGDLAGELLGIVDQPLGAGGLGGRYGGNGLGQRCHLIDGARWRVPDCRQRCGDVAGVGRAIRGVLGEQVQDEPVEPYGNLRADASRARRCRVQVVAHDRERLACREGRPAGQERVQHAAQGVQVAARIDLLSFALLRGHVGRSADGLPGGGEMGSGVCGLGDPEVADLHPALGKKEQVGRLEVTVDDLTGVRRAECLGDLDGQRNGRFDGQAGGGPGQHRPQIGAVQQFHDNEHLTVMQADIVHHGNPGMLQPRRDPGFALEPCGQPRIGIPLSQHLHRHRPVQLPVDASPHFARAAVAQQLLEEVPPGELEPSLHGRASGLIGAVEPATAT